MAAIAFEGRSRVRVEDLGIPGWVLVTALDADVHEFIDWWVRSHRCTHTLEYRVFRVELLTVPVDQRVVQVTCRSCGASRRAFADVVASGFWREV